MLSRYVLPLLLVATTPALAQRTTNNAVTSAEDAFGRSVGTEKIGIYSTEEVRGFNPLEAGNVRIEGLYFDQQSQPSSRLIDSSSVRVGYAARGYPFPAPTGIADLKLEKFDGKRIFSSDVEAESRRNLSASIQLKLPLAGDRLGISAGVGLRFANVPQGRNGNFQSMAINLGWTPYDGAEVAAFVSRFHFGKGRVSPVIFPAGSFVPARISRSVYLGQPWARNTSSGTTHGAIAKLPLGEFKLEAGLFRSTRDDPRSFADLQLGTDRDGHVASRVIIADEDTGSGSTSGEVRTNRVWQSNGLSHGLIAALRGRNQVRTFGGQQRVLLGASESGVRDDRLPPVLAFGAKSRSKVRQFTYGLGYDLRWIGHGAFSLAVQKSDYRKGTRFADPMLTETISRDRPLLFSANGSIDILPELGVYIGYVRGLEESAVAPDIAVNRDEAPPAIRTSQKDAGLRYAIAPKLSLIAGVFEVSKPYFNIDASGRFRQLGSVSNRGIEMSLAGTVAPGITIVAGNLFLDPKISGPEIIAGSIGKRPVGSFKRRSIANIDWKPEGQEAWSFDLAFESFSSETGNSKNDFIVSARETLGLGTRFRFKLGTTKLLVRGQVTNIFNAYGWRVNSSGGFNYALPRTAILNISADF
jgi:iron complex outermembrane receptor protein